jgi:uncharacterized protein (TIRG00374 family)
MILIILAFGLLFVLLYSNREVLSETWRTLQGINPLLLLILPLLQICSQLSLALFYQRFLKTFGKHVQLRRMLPMVWALTFVNQILPSGGASGLSYLIYGLRGQVPAGKATLAHITRYILSYFSYAIVLVVAFIFLVQAHQVTRQSLGFFIGLSAITLVGFMLFGYLLRDRHRIDRLTERLSRIVEYLARIFRHGKNRDKPLVGVEKLKNTLEEFHEGYENISRHKDRLRVPFLFILSSTFFENMVVYGSFLILGIDVNPGLILISFALANLAGVVSVIPGDVGVHEAAMIASLSVAGVPAGTALSATLLYRVFNKMLFVLTPDYSNPPNQPSTEESKSERTSHF